MAEATLTEIRPQAGPQEAFLSSDADIVIYGGQAGGGKTYGLLLEPLRHINNPHFGAVIFRKTYPQIMREGGLWDTSATIYPLAGAQPTRGDATWTFPGGARVSFAHIQYDANVYDWQGAQIPLIEFDELTHFSEKTFFYMLSRNRSTCGVRPYVRATCNPDADSWVAKLIEWWIDPEKGTPLPERSGVIRWFIRVNDTLVWADSAEEMRAVHPGVDPKSFTFIPASVYDNRILLEQDPGYLANLMALPLVDRERLLGGNWHIKPAAGKVFNRSWFEVVEAVPAGGRWCRGWDLAATEKKLAGDDPDYTAGCLIAKVEGRYYILDAIAEQEGPATVDRMIKNTAADDALQAQEHGSEYMVRWEIEPGSSGKRDNRNLATLLDGYNARGKRPQGDKLLRAKALSAQAEAGNVKLVRGYNGGRWIERWLTHMHHQPDWPHDDEMDGASIGYNELARPEVGIR